MSLNALARGSTSAASWRQKLLALLLLCFIIFHATMLVAFNLPYNVLTANIQRPLNRYIYPLFFQQWNFFAPTPGGWQDDTYVRFRVTNKSGQASSTTEWISGSSLFDAAAENRPLTVAAISRAMYFNLVSTVANDKSALAVLRSLGTSNKTVVYRQLPALFQMLDRYFMSVEPSFCFAGPPHSSFDVQLLVTRKPLTHFAERFHVGKQTKTDDLRAQSRFLTPWVRGEFVESALSNTSCITIAG